MEPVGGFEMLVGSLILMAVGLLLLVLSVLWPKSRTAILIVTNQTEAPMDEVVIQLSEPAYLNWRWGGGQSLDPPTNPDDKNRAAFEYGRKTAGTDESPRLVTLSDGTYGIKSPNGRSWLSIQGDGSYQERPVVEGEEPGPWERFTLEGTVLTELPKDGMMRECVEFVHDAA